MKFVRGTAEDVVDAIIAQLKHELVAGKRVLWLVSGGSNIALQVQIMHHVHDSKDLQLVNLVVMPMDERFGTAGHADSNAEQLRQAGFKPGAAKLIDVLERNLPFSQTVDAYSEAVASELASAQIVIGQFGMGDDGHVAGIKPNSPATAPGSATIIGYTWSDYERMTMSAEALLQIDSAYMPVYGENKQPALEKLRDNTVPFNDLPAKLLYDIPEAYVYNDYIETKE